MVPSTKTDAVERRLADGVLFPVGAEALVQACAAREAQAVTAGAAALVAVSSPAGRTVVASGNDPAISSNNCRDLAL